MAGNYSYVNGLRAKAFPITTSAGVTDTNLSLSGRAKCFNGLMIEGAAGTIANAVVTLIINNDTVIDGASAIFFAKDAANPRQYFEFFRELEGQDTITLRIEDTGAQQLDVLVYYQDR